MDYVIRKARESDRMEISRVIAYSFEKIFSVFTKDMNRMARVFEDGISIHRFYVAQLGDDIVGIIACGDSVERVLKSTKEICKAHLGAIRGFLAFRIIRSELMLPHPYPETTGYVDVLGVLAQARGRGIAKELLNSLIENNPQYNEFILDVDSINASAIKSYTDFGFVEYKRVQVSKFFKRSKIFMKYIHKK